MPSNVNSQNSIRAFAPVGGSAGLNRAKGKDSSPPLKGDSVSISSKKEAAPTKQGILKRLFGKRQPRKKEWTVMYYSSGGEDIEFGNNNALSQLRQSGSDKNVDFVAQKGTSGARSGVERMHVGQHPWLSIKPHYDVREDLSGVDMGNKETLKEFISWGMKNYPAKNYMIIFSGHGGGYQGAISDDNHKSLLSPGDVKEALDEMKEERGGKKTEGAFFDSCLMSSTEFAYELKDQLQYLAGTPEVQFGSGINYEKFADELKEDAKKGEATPIKVMANLTSKTRGDSLKSLTTLDLSHFEKLGESLKSLRAAIDKSPDDRKTLEDIAEKTFHYGREETLAQDQSEPPHPGRSERLKKFRDLKDFAQRVSNDKRLENPDLKKAANDILKTMEEAVVNNYVAPGTDYSQGGGLSIIASTDPQKGPRPEYKNLDFYKDTGWDGLV